MKTVRTGVYWARRNSRAIRWPPPSTRLPGRELFALATRDADRAQGFKDFCPDLAIHASYEALLADPAIEAVYIPLPNSLHVDWTLRALRAGKHVLCEKPIALKADQIDQLIIAARDQTGLLATEAYMIVHHPQWQRARQLVAGRGDRPHSARGRSLQL